jgi:flagellar assembly factor FliW
LGVIIKTGRFGQLSVGDDEIILIPNGIMGFPQCTKYCLVDPGDGTLILWLQSLENSKIAFPILEPRVFRADYSVRLSGAELRELKLQDMNQSAVFAILTIPEEVTQMTANLKAPLVINLSEQIARQVILQENEYSIKQLMFKELRTHLVNIEAQQKSAQPVEKIKEKPLGVPVAIKSIPASLTVKGLQS